MINLVAIGLECERVLIVSMTKMHELHLGVVVERQTPNQEVLGSISTGGTVLCL